MKTKEKVARVALKQMRLADLKDHKQNPRKHPNPGTPEWNVLKKSLANQYFDALVVNVRKGENHMTLVSGHLRRKVLTEMGYTAADVSTVDVDAPTHLAMMLAANQQQGQNDEKALATVLMALQAVPEFDVELTGFSGEQVVERVEMESVNAVDVKPWEIGDLYIPAWFVVRVPLSKAEMVRKALSSLPTDDPQIKVESSL